MQVKIHKKKHSEIYNEVKKEFITDFNKQSSLLIESINHLKNQKKSFNALVPIHGKTIEDYHNYYLKIRDLENKEKYEFDGFALGGLSTFRKGNDIAKIINFIRSKNDNRIIHILGSSGLDKLFSLIYSGADSFDCHSPWRRASDGQPKFLIPLLNSNLEIVHNEDTLAYRPIEYIKSSKGCDCDVCTNYEAKEIYEILNGNNEDNYFAKILLYFITFFNMNLFLKSNNLKKMNLFTLLMKLKI